MAVPAEKKDRYTYADNLTWDDDVRRELIEGEIYVMSPATRRAHQGLLGALHVQVASYLEGSDDTCETYVAWIYRLAASGEYEPAEVVECTGTSPVGVVPGLEIDWDRAFARVPREL